MKSAVRNTAKLTGTVSVASALVSAVAMVGGPAAVGLSVTLAILLGWLCWVLNDPGRSERLVQVIHAVRGTTAVKPGEEDQPSLQAGEPR